MARPLPVSPRNKEKPSPRADISSKVLAALIVLDGRQQDQGKALMDMEQARSADSAETSRRLRALESRLNEVIELLRGDERVAKSPTLHAVNGNGEDR